MQSVVTLSEFIIKRFVVVQYQFEGIHAWIDCPLPAVTFLKCPHRHMFHVRAEKEVTHNDREVEIIMLKRDMEQFSNEYAKTMTTESCEEIAERLLLSFQLTKVTVLEDGENGATLLRVNSKVEPIKIKEGF